MLSALLVDEPEPIDSRDAPDEDTGKLTPCHSCDVLLPASMAEAEDGVLGLSMWAPTMGVAAADTLSPCNIRFRSFTSTCADT